MARTKSKIKKIKNTLFSHRLRVHVGIDIAVVMHVLILLLIQYFYIFTPRLLNEMKIKKKTEIHVHRYCIIMSTIFFFSYRLTDIRMSLCPANGRGRGRCTIIITINMTTKRAFFVYNNTLRTTEHDSNVSCSRLFFFFFSSEGNL